MENQRPVQVEDVVTISSGYFVGQIGKVEEVYDDGSAIVKLVNHEKTYPFAKSNMSIVQKTKETLRYEIFFDAITNADVISVSSKASEILTVVERLGVTSWSATIDGVFVSVEKMANEV